MPSQQQHCKRYKMAERGARPLIVDDNKVNRLLLTRSVEMQGHHAMAAENGRLALDPLEREHFDLMLLDMEMPEMDGFEVIEHLSANFEFSNIPVIVTSSLDGILATGSRQTFCNLRSRCRFTAVWICARWPSSLLHGYVLRYSRFYGACRIAATGRYDRAAKCLLSVNV